MKNFLLLLILGGAGYYAYQHFFPTAELTDAQGNARVVLFTFKACGAPCDDALNVIRSKRIEFEHVDLSSGPEAEQKLRELGGGQQMPLLLVGGRRVEGFERHRFSEALAERFGLEILDGANRRVMKTHFNSDGSPAVVMYGAAWCPYCKAAREHFQREGIPFKEWDVEQDETGKMYFEPIKSGGYPLIYVGLRRFEGFDKRGIEKAMNSHRLIAN